MANIKSPRKKFNFSIQIVPAPINPFLAQKVTAPEIGLGVAKHGDTNHDIKTAGRVEIGDITIEKIISTGGADNYFFDWLKSCNDELIGGGLVPDEYKRQLLITELAEDGTSILNTHIAIGCWPNKINGMDFDRMSTENSVESITLSVDKYDKI